ncbi:ATPase [Acidipropionibacterium acidipropionici]|uniref:ATPase n=1 Tax=Acidipropionibacterium acidipropionici TaxID=1748 RepID=A0AAC8YH28_9ACTN|nr:ABC-ATPase domain-containing protein [Acidipropionibacterium acidipropionici]AMS06556.1 ATPase [Acidipropionibacterium acidipropionici]AOZ47998.1 ATPase [Acidipropionibacterium acidipropionici]AZP38652.1 ATPase [Acidipropionibacterium acidipropionici]
MRDVNDLEDLLHSIDGRGYGGYKRLAGSFALPGCRVAVDHVQADPYAPPALVRVMVDADQAGLPDDLVDDRAGRVATADFLTRGLVDALRSHRDVSIGQVGQEVLERTHVVILPDRLEARLQVQLPAAGRRVKGRQAFRILSEDLPDIADLLLHHNLDAARLRTHVALCRDQEALRGRLAGLGLVAFVADGSVLPRRSGDSDLPLDEAVPFTSPESLRVDVDLPSGRRLTGMGVPEGVTVIVGGGYHGKSTLLRALERGVHPHIGGDGREWVVTRPDAVAVRAEDGRSVTGTDISAFIADLPSGTRTERFSTTNASGSTSQAANLAEAVEAGASALLIDEDTSATNFMIRDERMRRLIPADREPITPFVDRVRPLRRERGVSTVLVAGGSGAFFDVADHVIAMERYLPCDVTARAREIAGIAAPAETQEAVFEPTPERIPARGCLPPAGRRRPARARGTDTIQIDRQIIDLSALSQLVDPAQTAAIARVLDRISELLDGTIGIVEATARIDELIDAEGLDALSGFRGHPGFLARPRTFEIGAALNRYRDLRLR